MSDNREHRNAQAPVYIEDFGFLEILRKPKRKTPKSSKQLPYSRNRVKDDQSTPGTLHATPNPPMPTQQRNDNEEVNPIANAPLIEPPEGTIPDRFEFEMIRLRRRVAELECTVRDRDDRISKALGMIEDELQFWRTGLHQHVWETMAGVMRRIVKLEGTVAYLKEKGSRFYPPLEIPERWRKKGQ